MRSIYALSLCLIINSPNAYAALATDAGSALPFYRNKTSMFPSGQASRSALESRLNRTETEVLYRVQWDRKDYQLTGQNILRDIQVSRFADTKIASPLRALDRVDSLQTKTLLAKTTVEILETQDYWARVKEKNGTGQGWMPLELLQTRHDDLGVFVNYIPTAVRIAPDSFSKKIADLPRLQRIVPLNLQSNFMKVQYKGQIGYVDLTHFVSRADFANLTYHPKKNWMTVAFRNNDKLLTAKGETVSMNDVLGYVTNPERGVVVRPSISQSYGPPIRAHVTIQKPEANVWGLSRLDGHGEVWWKKTNLLIVASADTNQVSTESLLKREIYSIAFESKSSVRGLVSSEGVYRSDDGLHWTLIPQFGKQNYPVSIHPNGTWFVGSYKSSDKGKTFEPFIRWDKIAEAIQGAYHRNPKILKLTKIEALSQSQVQIYVDTGSSQVKLRSAVGDLSWSVVKTN